MHSLLVIEPDVAQGKQASMSLEQAGFQVWVMPSIEQADRLCQTESPDAIILDPGQLQSTWSVFASHYLEHHPDASLIIHSTDDSRSALIAALQIGAADFVMKEPNQFDALADALHRVFATQQHRHSAKLHLMARNTLSSIEEDLRAGRHVQRSLLPDKPFKMHGIKADYELHASLYLSGDLVDYFELQPGWFFFYILDVSGHGVASALVTILLRNEINRLRRDWHLGMDETIEHPHLVLLHLNGVLQHSELGKHATLWLGLLDVRLKTLHYANAGHYPYPLLQIDDQQHWLKESRVPVGLFAQPNYETHLLHYERQLSIALCSDGVFELMSVPSLEDREALWAEVVRSNEFNATRIAEALNVSAQVEAMDDMTIMMISHGEECS